MTATATYSHIVHLADIHIRTERTDEYNEVFDRLYASIREKASPNPLIVICGDVIHERSRITPEVIRKTLNFLTNLSKIGKCILINGNHDIIENNSVRDKFLEVIPKNDNVDYMTKSGHYYYDNIRVSISALDDKKFIRYEEPPPSKITELSIHLGHYTIKEVSPHMQATYSVADHKGYDFALLGDIHSRSKYQNCYYSGSLIQQNFGESREKGYGLIDVRTKSYDFIDIPNDYGFITVNVSAELPTIITELPRYVNLRLCREAKYEYLDKEYEDLYKKHTKVMNVKTILPSAVTADTLLPLQAIINEIDEYDDLAIVEALATKLPNKDDIIALHKKYRIDTKIITKNRANFYLKKLDFENIMNYDTKCRIGFEELQGIIGIHGNNASGKSNILRTIIFALCGSISVDYAARDDKGRKSTASANQFAIKYSYDVAYVLNRSAKKGHTEITFNYDNVDYQITRNLTRKSDGGVSSTVKLCRYDSEANRMISLSADNKKNTDLEIHNMVGRSALFMLMNVYNRESTSIVNCSARERYNMVASLFDTEMFESIANMLQKDIKEQRQEYTKYVGQMEYLKDDIGEVEEVNVDDILEEEEMLKKENITLRQHHTPDLPKVSEININVDDAKKLRQDLKKAESRIINTLPEGTSHKASRNDYDTILSRYSALRNLKEPTPVEEPPNYTAYSREELVRVLNKHNQPLQRSSPPTVATISQNFPKNLEHFDTNLPKKIAKNFDKNDIEKHIKFYEKNGVDFDRIQEQIDQINVPTEKIKHKTIEEVRQLLNRYPENSHFERVVVRKDKILSSPVSIASLAEVREELEQIEVHPLRKIATKKPISTSLNELQDKADKIIDIDEIVSSLIKDGATPTNINKVKKIKKLLPKLSEIYREMNALSEAIEVNKKIDEDIAFNTQQQKNSERRNQLELTLNTELHYRNLHMDYIEELKALELFQQKQSLQNQLKEEKKKREKYEEYVTLLKDMEYNEYYDQNIAIHFDEIRRHIAYIDYQEALKNYKEKLGLEANLRYFNSLYQDIVTQTRTKLSSINAFIEEKISSNVQKLLKLSELLNKNKLIKNTKNIREKLSKLSSDLSTKSDYQNLLTKEGGIKNFILSKYINYIQDSINSNLINYRIGLTLDGNSLHLTVHKKSIVLQPQQLSGYEAFALELSTKQTLNRFSTVGTSQVLILDEGFDVLDIHNKEIFQMLLQRLKSQYRHILLISHDDYIKSMSDVIITPDSVRSEKKMNFALS